MKKQIFFAQNKTLRRVGCARFEFDNTKVSEGFIEISQNIFIRKKTDVVLHTEKSFLNTYASKTYVVSTLSAHHHPLTIFSQVTDEQNFQVLNRNALRFNT